MRREAEFLVSQGHLHAGRYPLARLWSEARLARDRVNGQTAVEAMLLHAAVVQVLTGKGPFEAMLKDLRNG